MREILTSGSMSGMWKRSTVRIMRHRQTKEPEIDRPDRTHRATSRLYRILALVGCILLSLRVEMVPGR
jgi:hypothetical protein